MVKKKTKKIEKATVEKKPRIVEVGCYSFAMNEDEMLSIIQILIFSKEIFEQMALDCHKQGNEKAMQTYGARAKLSLMLYEKFKDVAEIGEPISNEFH